MNGSRNAGRCAKTTSFEALRRTLSPSTGFRDACFGPAPCSTRPRGAGVQATSLLESRSGCAMPSIGCTESGTPCRVPVAVIGPRGATPPEQQTAFSVGAGLAALGIVLLCGGKGGVMEAACEGAASAGGVSIGLLPKGEWQAANRFVTVPIATGIGEARNAIIARRLGADRDRRRLRHVVRDRAGAAVRPSGADAAAGAGCCRRASHGFGRHCARRDLPGDTLSIRLSAVTAEQERTKRLL
jgi:hypothetical protein